MLWIINIVAGVYIFIILSRLYPIFNVHAWIRGSLWKSREPRPTIYIYTFQEELFLFFKTIKVNLLKRFWKYQRTLWEFTFTFFYDTQERPNIEHRIVHEYYIYFFNIKKERCKVKHDLPDGTLVSTARTPMYRYHVFDHNTIIYIMCICLKFIIHYYGMPIAKVHSVFQKSQQFFLIIIDIIEFFYLSL